MTRFSSRAVLLLAVLALPGAALAGENKKARNAYPVKYEGGSLPLSRNKVKASLGGDEVVLAQRRQRIAVPAREIVEISCGSQVHRRVALPLVHIKDAETYYIGVSWAGDGGAARTEALFRVSGAEYRQLLASLERMTGKKAIDTRQIPTAVRYTL